MRERRCFVQFIHPGGEHWPDQGDPKFWNRDAHRRKFLKSPGRYIEDGDLRDGEILFWGEWEPESKVVARYTDRAPDGPHFLYEPFFVEHRNGAWRQNTDPFVFGERFHYTGCLQHTRRGPTQLRFLAPGSLVLFGSCREKSRFVVDTVLVVSDYLDHTPGDWQETVDGEVSTTYSRVTLEPWYRGAVPEVQSHRLYFGATPDRPVGEMFSFFPCRPYDETSRGFARPEINIPGFITSHLTQGKKIARDLSLAEMSELWKQVVRQVESAGLSLGTYAELPPRGGEGGRRVEDPDSVGRC
ncbi:MAG: hypothetical protein H0U03_10780 [Actinobacteria bacterium]|nr:hypothetical protein [Actinomycetota bacterium]